MAVLAVAGKEQKLAILRDTWLSVPPLGIDTFAKRADIFKLSVFEIGLVNIAEADCIGAVACLQNTRSAIGCYGKRADISFAGKLQNDLWIAPFGKRSALGTVNDLLAVIAVAGEIERAFVARDHRRRAAAHPCRRGRRR